MTITITKAKLAIGILAMVLVGATAAVAVDDNPFTDVPDSEEAGAPFFSEPVEWLWDNGLTTGTSDTTFSPGDNVTRGQYAAFNFRYDQNIVQPLIEALQTELDAAEAEIAANAAAAPTIYHAWVTTGGSSSTKSDGVTTSLVATGNYTVAFPVDVKACTWQVTNRVPNGLFIFDPDVTSEPEFTLSTRNQAIFPGVDEVLTDVSVSVTDQAGDPAKASFDLTVICP